MAWFMQNIAIPAAMIAVGVVLVLGLWNMLKGGSGNTSQKLMRMRVLLQGIAIALVMFTLWVLGR